MKKIRIELTETLKYQREFVIVVPEEVTDREIEQALSKAEREEFAEDASYVFQDLIKGSTITNYLDNDLSSPMSGEVEFDDYEEID